MGHTFPLTGWGGTGKKKKRGKFYRWPPPVRICFYMRAEMSLADVDHDVGAAVINELLSSPQSRTPCSRRWLRTSSRSMHLCTAPKHCWTSSPQSATPSSTPPSRLPYVNPCAAAPGLAPSPGPIGKCGRHIIVISVRSE